MSYRNVHQTLAGLQSLTCRYTATVRRTWVADIPMYPLNIRTFLPTLSIMTNCNIKAPWVWYSNVQWLLHRIKQPHGGPILTYEDSQLKWFAIERTFWDLFFFYTTMSWCIKQTLISVCLKSVFFFYWYRLWNIYKSWSDDSEKDLQRLQRWTVRTGLFPEQHMLTCVLGSQLHEAHQKNRSTPGEKHLYMKFTFIEVMCAIIGGSFWASEVKMFMLWAYIATLIISLDQYTIHKRSQFIWKILLYPKCR